MTSPKDRRENENRWRTPDGQELAKEIWRRLGENDSLCGLPTGEYEGRIDLRGISAPEVIKEALPNFRSWQIQKIKGRMEFRNVHFEGIDFSDARLDNVQFFNSRISGCRFEGADCKDMGLRATDVTRTSFAGASLRDAVLGPWYQGRGNRYEFVDFNGADMRGLISTTATYVDCDFAHAKLDKIDFQSSSFIRCRFAGELREVLFYGKTFDTKKEERNPMEDVDFSQAQLRWVAFRGLDLDRIRWPEDENHLVLKNYPCVLKHALASVKDAETQPGRGLSRVLANLLKWVGPEQHVGVVNRLDLVEAWGEDGAQFAADLLRRAEQECSRSQ